MNDYLVRVEPKGFASTDIASYRLSNKTEEYKDGFVEALKLTYTNYNKYEITCEEIKPVKH